MEIMEKRIPVNLYTDLEDTLESIALTKQVDRKSLRMMVRELKDRLLEGEVSLYAWLPKNHMWADILTKEMRLPESQEQVLRKNEMDLPDVHVNEVKAVDGEMRMENDYLS